MQGSLLRVYITFFIWFGFLVTQAQSGKLSLRGLNIDSIGIERWYDEQIGLQNTQLQVGEQERGLFKAQKGHPYFLTKIWTLGSLKYRNQEFDQVSILYNIEEDFMMIRQVGNAGFNPSLVKLIQEQVSWFSVGDNHFEYLRDNVGQHNPGYFQVLFSENSLRLLVKRTKIIELDNVPTYIPRDDYFIHYGDQFHLIRSKRSIYRIYPEKRKLIRGFIRERQIKLPKMETDADFVLVMEYINQLLK